MSPRTQHPAPPPDRDAAKKEDAADSQRRFVKLEPLRNTELDALLKWATRVSVSMSASKDSDRAEAWKHLDNHERLAVRLLVSGRTKRADGTESTSSPPWGFRRQRRKEKRGIR